MSGVQIPVVAVLPVSVLHWVAGALKTKSTFVVPMVSPVRVVGLSSLQFSICADANLHRRHPLRQVRVRRRDVSYSLVTRRRQVEPRMRLPPAH